MRFRFVHAADLHLDTPFSGIGRSSEEVAGELREASLAAWDRLVELTVSRDAAFLVLAGDIYDGAKRGLRAQMRFRAGVGRLAESGIRLFAVWGNHDPLDEGWSAVREWPPEVHFFGSDSPGAIAVERQGRRIATVYGISYAVGEESRNLARLFRRQTDPGLHIGVLHTNAGGDPEYGNYAPCSVQDLVSAQMDYWALGHVHRHRVLRRGDPWIAYSGCLQGRSPAAGELGPKGALVVECDSELGVIGVEFVALDSVRFDRLDVDVSNMADLADALTTVAGEAGRLQAEQHGGRGLLLRARMHGTPVWASDLARTGGVADLRGQLQEQLAESEPFVWLDELEVDVRLPLDREQIRQRGDFAAELITQAETLLQDPQALAALLDSLAGELRAHGLADAAERGTVDPRALIMRAEARCLALMATATPTPTATVTGGERS
jgi:DNA repair protein SbcD/Mre11